MTAPYHGVESITLSEPLLKTRCTLGEGPLYDPRTNVLHFVDISCRKVYNYCLESKGLTIHEYGEPVSALAIRADGPGLACIAKRGFALLHPPTSDASKGELEYLATPLDESYESKTRFNDGACDAKGRFIAGTLATEKTSGGLLWSLGVDGEGARILDSRGISDSNGLGWSQDNKRMYFTDSRNSRIFVYDYDIDTGVTSNRRVHIEIPEEYGLPDGLCFDDQEGLWSAYWRGSKIVRFSKEGKPTLVINIPGVLTVTACTFGGLNNDKLFITTASPELDPEANAKLDDYPQSGNLFELDFSGRFKGGVWRHTFRG